MGRPETVHFAARPRGCLWDSEDQKTCRASERFFAERSGVFEVSVSAAPAADVLVIIVTLLLRAAVVLEGYSWQIISSHLAVGRNERFYLPLNGRQLLAENNPLV